MNDKTSTSTVEQLIRNEDREVYIKKLADALACFVALLEDDGYEGIADGVRDIARNSGSVASIRLPLLRDVARLGILATSEKTLQAIARMIATRYGLHYDFVKVTFEAGKPTDQANSDNQIDFVIRFDPPLQ